jgi:hypothetical protein
MQKKNIGKGKGGGRDGRKAARGGERERAENGRDDGIP